MKSKKTLDRIKVANAAKKKNDDVDPEKGNNKDFMEDNL